MAVDFVKNPTPGQFAPKPRMDFYKPEVVEAERQAKALAAEKEILAKEKAELETLKNEVEMEKEETIEPPQEEEKPEEELVKPEVPKTIRRKKK